MNLVPPASLAIPLAENENATIIFDVANGTQLDPLTGNLQPVNIQVTLKAILHSVRKADAFFMGADKKQQRMRGRLTNPKNLPSGIGHLSKGIATIGGKQGTFILHHQIQNPYVKGVLGDKIEGVFEVD